MADITLRLAASRDERLLWEWVNEAAVRESAFDQEHIIQEVHHRWFQGQLCNSAEHVQLIGEMDGVPFGQIRFDIEGACATADVSVSVSNRGRGRGTGLIKMGIGWLQRNCPNVTQVTADVRLTNLGSIRAFQKAGFCQIHEFTNDPPCVRLQWEATS